METIVIGILIFLLFALAITDLIVGVSNDAVNFLNSAIGSKVASRTTIMTVASLGIIIGASLSNGMMEVARKGIFNPEFFLFKDLIIVFLAVMFTDIILLDLFNTFGLPTSTTVSIVFELLGASVMVAFLKVSASGEGLQELGTYINSAKALAIIAAILLSVALSFTAGAIIQFFARLLFSFKNSRRSRALGPIWSGLAMTALTFFLLIKGLKGASFNLPPYLSGLESASWDFVLYTFLIFTALSYILRLLIRVNTLRLVVLYGTFSLAMAFASNDLVNFIGVPVAGLESFHIWQDAGSPLDGLTMDRLAQPIATSPWILLGAGIIMALTLWFSRKARSVTDTEVSLGRQEEGNERFSPNAVSRAVVKAGMSFYRGVETILPPRLKGALHNSFKEEPRTASTNREDPPAFDLVRASVNLTVASVLIALATNLKLPLSTTYVSFMVAMGSSLSDRAWGRDSAVYRVAGVFNVIGGWFLTALLAFSAAAIFAFAIHRFEVYGLVVVLAILVFSVVRSFRFHKTKVRNATRIKSLELSASNASSHQFVLETKAVVTESLREIKMRYQAVLQEVVDQNSEELSKLKKAMKRFAKRNEAVRGNIPRTIRLLNEAEANETRQYILVFDLEHDMVQGVRSLTKECFNHVENRHTPLNDEQQKMLFELSRQVASHFELVLNILEESKYESYPQLVHNKYLIYRTLDGYIEELVSGIRQKEWSSKAIHLLLRQILESKDLLAVTTRFVRLFKEVAESKETPGEHRGAGYRVKV